MEKVAKAADLKDKLCASAKGKELALFKVKDNNYCTDNECAHLGGPLCKGKLEGFIVKCPWHGSEFDVRDGAVKGGPAKTAIKSYKTTQSKARTY